MRCTDGNFSCIQFDCKNVVRCRTNLCETTSDFNFVVGINGGKYSETDL